MNATPMRRTALLSLRARRWRPAACGKKKPPVARPMPPPPPRRPRRRHAGRRRRPSRSREPTIVPPEPVRDDAIASASLDDLNRNSPLKPVFFELDSSDVERRRPAGARRERRRAEAVPDLGRSPSKDTATSAAPPSTIWHWANAARSRRAPIWCRSGIPADRLRTVSYGKEFPFDPGHDEAAFAKNRRAHFVITAK